MRHLYIQENQIGSMLLDGLDRLSPIRAFGNDFDVGFLGQDNPHALAGQRFVINVPVLETLRNPVTLVFNWDLSDRP